MVQCEELDNGSVILVLCHDTQARLLASEILVNDLHGKWVRNVVTEGPTVYLTPSDESKLPLVYSEVV